MDSSDSLPASNIVTAWVFRPVDKLPIIKKAVSVESKSRAMRFWYGSSEAGKHHDSSGEATAESVAAGIGKISCGWMANEVRQEMCQSPP